MNIDKESKSQGQKIFWGRGERERLGVGVSSK